MAKFPTVVITMIVGCVAGLTSFALTFVERRNWICASCVPSGCSRGGPYHLGVGSRRWGRWARPLTFKWATACLRHSFLSWLTDWGCCGTWTEEDNDNDDVDEQDTAAEVDVMVLCDASVDIVSHEHSIALHFVSKNAPTLKRYSSQL